MIEILKVLTKLIRTIIIEVIKNTLQFLKPKDT